MEKDFLLGCDWGTTTFRLTLCDAETLAVRAEVRSDEGVASTFRDWKESDPGGAVSRERYFRRRLGGHLARLSQSAGMSVEGIPLVVSGMASSSLGMQELPYANLPFSLDGGDAVSRYRVGDGDLPNDILLLSGVRGAADVMRGEETQVLGLMHLLAAKGIRPDRAKVLFPGTHCKHIHLEGEAIVSFQTFMTGEVFGILRQHSILADSVDAAPLTGHSPDAVDAFREGVQTSLESPFLHALFSVRTNQLFDRFDRHLNAYYLSGLLIGSELQSLSEGDDAPIILCSSSHLHDVYRFGLEALGLLSRTSVLSGGMTERATLAGQALLLSKTKEA
ncbi:MAG: 2-dehydro-3-deoxygalactonokinase [Bacteroidetes bacterium]|nr:2-dehydro-3-deoxygalactonokinase [Bacteroidota bacterium]